MLNVLTHPVFRRSFTAQVVAAQLGQAIAAAVLTAVATLAAITAARLWPAHAPVIPTPAVPGGKW